jgi:hypothetical protein
MSSPAKLTVASSRDPVAPATTELRDPQAARAFDAIERALQDLRFGQVIITVQDGVIVQIERSEKTRLR